MIVMYQYYDHKTKKKKDQYDRINNGQPMNLEREGGEREGKRERERGREREGGEREREKEGCKEGNRRDTIQYCTN